jgi:hypothetical protein
MCAVAVRFAVCVAGQDGEQLVGDGEGDNQEGEEERERGGYCRHGPSCVVWDALVAVVERNHGVEMIWRGRRDTFTAVAVYLCKAHVRPWTRRETRVV